MEQTSSPRSTGGIGSIIVIIAAIMVALLVFGSNFGRQISQPTPQTGNQPTPINQTTTGSLTSLDWCGYTVSSDTLNPSPIVTSVTASWKIPTISDTGTDSFSAAWVGIGGQFDESLIQAGTEQDSVGGVANYSCWYELLPLDSVSIDTVTVKPGDTITVTITLLNPQTHEWSIELRDTTNSQSFSDTVNYNSSMLSAEWIVERPTVNNFEPPLAAFGPITFTNCSATLGGVPGNILSFQENRFILFGRTNNELAYASAPSDGGSSFTVTYLISR